MLPIPVRDKIPVSQAILYGWLFINLPVLFLMFGLPVVFLLLTDRKDSNAWLPLAGFLVGFVLAWVWWSFATPKWRLWAIRRVDNLYNLHIQAVRAQLVWPHGSIYEHTEFKSPLHVLKEKHVQIHHYFDKFRYYLDYLDSSGNSFYGLQETRQGVDNFREVLYYCDKNPLYTSDLKISIDQLRITLKGVRAATGGDEWPELIDALQEMLNDYQNSSKQLM
jgi:hypothetical protein